MGQAWSTKKVWAVAEKKIAKTWGEVFSLAQFRQTCALVAKLGFPPKAQYARIDLVHNAWVTYERRKQSVLEVDDETLEAMPE